VARFQSPRKLGAVAIPDFELRQVKALLAHYCEARVPARVRHKLNMGFSVRGSAVTLFERGLVSTRQPNAWRRASHAFVTTPPGAPGRCTVCGAI
jgi:hypothetical protein